MRVHCLFLLAVLVAYGTSPLSAHHSARAAFDADHPATLSGVIARLTLTNPHATIELTVKDADGKATGWVIEWAPPGVLKRNIDLSSLAIGSQITVEVWPSKDGRKLANVRSLTTSDGKKFDMADNWADMSLPNRPTATPR